MKTSFDTAFWIAVSNRMKLGEFDRMYGDRFKRSGSRCRQAGFGREDLHEAIRLVKQLGLEVDLSFLESDGEDLEGNRYAFDYLVRTNSVDDLKRMVQSIDTCADNLGPVRSSWIKLKAALMICIEHFEKERIKVKYKKKKQIEPPTIEEILRNEAV